MVAPQVEVVRPMLHRSDGAIPVVHVIHAETVGDASAREAHEPRVQIGKGLHQVRTEVLEPPIRGARLKGDEIEIHNAFGPEAQSQSTLSGHHRTGFRPRAVAVRRHGQRRFAFRPCRMFNVDGGFGDAVAVIVAQRYGQRHRHTGLQAQPGGEIIGLPRSEHHAVPAGVVQRSRGVFDLDARIMRVFDRHRIAVTHAESRKRSLRHDLAPEAVVAPIHIVSTAVFEGSILHEISIETAVAGIADVFEEDAPQVGADVAYARLIERCSEFVGHVLSFAFPYVVLNTVNNRRGAICGPESLYESHPAARQRPCCGQDRSPE